MSASRSVNKIISKWGEPVTVKPRSGTMNQYGGFEYSYPEEDWFETIALVHQSGGLRENWMIVGVENDIDYIALFSSKFKDSIHPNDLVILHDGTECLVDTIVTRGKSEMIDFLEVLLKRREK